MCYGGIMLYVVMAVLRETKPARKPRLSCCKFTVIDSLSVYYVAGLAMFAAAQVIFFLASEPLCKVSPNDRVQHARADYRT